MKNEITRLVCFDFDGTLVDTGMPETHKPIWKEKTGFIFPAKTFEDSLKFKTNNIRGWWGRKESLDLDVFEFDVKSIVTDSHALAVDKEDTMVIMLTGRRKKLSSEVKKILDSHNLHFDEYRFNYGSDTFSNKIEQLEEILNNNETIMDVELWDDRKPDFIRFNEWGNELVKIGRLKSFKLNEVFNPQWEI